MRLVSAAVLLVVLLGLAACSYVEGNYPEPKIPPPTLPEEWKNREGESAPVVWQEAPELRGFFAGWVDMEKLLPMVRTAAQTGDARAVENLGHLEEVVANDLTWLAVAVFIDRAAERRLGQGRFTIEFADATRTQDAGVVFYEPHKKGPRRHSTRDGTQTLKGKYAETGKPLYLEILVPEEHNGKTVTAVRLS